MFQSNPLVALGGDDTNFPQILFSFTATTLTASIALSLGKVQTLRALKMPAVLVTGGIGYIGSFTVLALLQNGYKVVIIDNLYNASQECINRIELISGKRPDLFEGDITNEADFDKIFTAHPDIDSVIHFAALKVR